MNNITTTFNLFEFTEKHSRINKVGANINEF